MNKLVIATLLLFVVIETEAQSKNFIDQPYLEVSGSSDTLVTPDEIYLNFTISEKDSKDRIPLEELERKMFDALKKAGIDVEKNLTTSDMGSNFRSKLFNKDVIKSKQYVLKTENAVSATKVLIELEKLDIANAYVERVAHSQIRKFQNRMRTRAVENARDGAIALVTPLKQSLGSAIHISDGHYQPVDNLMRHGQAEMMYAKSSAALPEIEFNKIKVQAQVQVKFALK